MEKNKRIEVVLTKARIDKGLIAIPREYAQHFPKESRSIEVTIYFPEVDKNGYVLMNMHHNQYIYTSIGSSSRESRIYGLRKLFNLSKVSVGDKVSINVLEVGKYTMWIVRR